MTQQDTLFDDDRPIEPKPKGPELWSPKRCLPPRREVQRMLLTGLDCLPGQQDLFAVDGDRTQ